MLGPSMDHDSNQELNPNMVIVMVLALVLAGAATVGFIVQSSEARTQAAAKP
jgi:hypothetical protein